MAMDPTPPSESAPEPNALPATADDHVALTGNMTIGSMATGGLTVRSDTPLPLRIVLVELVGCASTATAAATVGAV